MGIKRHSPEEIVTKLRQVEALISYLPVIDRLAGESGNPESAEDVVASSRLNLYYTDEHAYLATSKISNLRTLLEIQLNSVDTQYLPL